MRVPRRTLPPCVLLSLVLPTVEAQCPSPSGKIQPSVASGYNLQVVATGLSRPRGLAFDGAGRLLVVESGKGSISAHTITEQTNGCTVATDPVQVVGNMSLNHGIQINGTTLFASSSDKLYSWSYDDSSASTSDEQLLITDMEGSDHSTRTLQLSRHMPGYMVISRGSLENLDINATTIAGGTAQVKAFDLSGRSADSPAYTWNADGHLLAWGVRNEVGLAEHPETGGIFGVENSADQVSREGEDVSNDNPGEELNFFGRVEDSVRDREPPFYGYPWCLSVWDAASLPANQNLSTGEQFAFDASPALDGRNQTDAFCAQAATRRAVQVFQAHQAPLDLKFNASGTEAWIAFHGSWDRRQPVGYHVSVVQFADGMPTEPRDSRSAEKVVVANRDNAVCPDDCFRPVAMALDARGRVFFSSDATGEVYVISRDGSSSPASTSSSAPSKSSPAESHALSLHETSWNGWLGGGLILGVGWWFI